MKKVLFSFLIVICVVVQSCQRKASETAADSTGSGNVSSDSSISPNPSMNYNPDYHTPPSNRVADAIAWTTATLNNRDSAGFWNSFTWENRDSVGYSELFRETRTLWDSTQGAYVDVSVVSTNVFSHTVHDTRDVALFAHALVNMRITGAKRVLCDSLTAILRVENGKWLMGSYSFDDPNKPFRVSSEP
jgi:hypothetical protein